MFLTNIFETWGEVVTNALNTERKSETLVGSSYGYYLICNRMGFHI